MIDVYYWNTPNGHKVTMGLEELEIPYRIKPVDIGKGEQFEPDFLAISPNNRIPAIVDNNPSDGGEPVPVFESGAILLYLADRSGKLIPPDLRGRNRVLQWLFWQMGNFGPMLGQAHHFCIYAPETVEYAIDRYVREASRLYAVLNRQLQGRKFIDEAYSIADIACYPWVFRHERHRQDLDDFPEVRRWFEAVRARPATARAYARAVELGIEANISDDASKVLFGQDSSVVN